MAKQEKKGSLLGSITGHTELEKTVGELSIRLAQLAQKGRQQTDEIEDKFERFKARVNTSLEDIYARLERLEENLEDEQGLVKIPKVRVGAEGHVQVLAEKIEATQARLDMLTLSVAKIPK